MIATIANDSARSAYRRTRAEPLTLGSEAFALRRTSSEEGWVVWAFGGDDTGLVYAGLDVARQVRRQGLSTFTEKTEAPAFPFRALKFNLPWSTYREHETLSLHYDTCRDLAFWERFLDMMAENRFNRLTLWAIHPWTYMVRPRNFPEASGLSDHELREWQSFWHSLFGMARERGIQTFMVNWNIFTSPEFSKAHGVAEYSQHLDRGYNGDGDYSELVQRYNREVVAQVLEEYPELTGIGVSQNERMKGVPEEVWQQWIVDTYFTVVEQADREVELMVRGHTHPAPALTRAAVEQNAHRLPDPVWLPLKFNWSHGHASPRLAYIHGGSSSDEWWNPAPKNYKVVFTIRNEDFFVLRWGQPDFIRELLASNDQDFVGGFMIGSETYIPAREFITRPGDHLTWDYAFEKQWLFYEMWGRLLYDPTHPRLGLRGRIRRAVRLGRRGDHGRGPQARGPDAPGPGLLPVQLLGLHPLLGGLSRRGGADVARPELRQHLGLPLRRRDHRQLRAGREAVQRPRPGVRQEKAEGTGPPARCRPTSWPTPSSATVARPCR